MVELLKSRFHGIHDNHSTTKCFLPFLVKIFQMLPELIIFNFKTLNFLGVGLPDFRVGYVEK